MNCLFGSGIYNHFSQTHHREHSENHMKVEEKTISFYIDELVDSTLFNAEANPLFSVCIAL
jgi:hypothetical protein